MAAKKTAKKKSATKKSPKRPTTRKISEEGMANIIRANRKRWKGYHKLSPREKKKVLGGGRYPATA